jgi:cytochrome c-type biogenesis protein CcmH/NrfG
VKSGDLERAAAAWNTFLQLSPGGERRSHVQRAVAAMAELKQAIESAPTE